MKFSKIFIIFSIVLFLFVSCQQKDKKQTQSDENQTVSNSTPVSTPVLTQNYDAAFSITLNTKEIINLQKIDEGIKVDTYSKPILFFFTNSWCVPCKLQIPILNNIQAKYQDKIEIIGILKEDMSNLNNFMKDNNISFKISANQGNDFFAKVLDISEIPYMVLVLKNGKFGSKFVGIIPEEMLENDILRFL